MQIPGKKIATALENLLKKEVKRLKKQKKSLMLSVILAGKGNDQISFVKIKAKTARRLGIKFELLHLKTIPSFEEFMHKIKEKSLDVETTGIIIQQPLPAQLTTESLYEYIPTVKEIEGHKHKTTYLPPIGLAILTVLKFIFGTGKIDANLFVDIKKDSTFFRKTFRNKKIVLIGRGITGGKPIGLTLNAAKINYISISSQTPQPETYYKEADVIITAVGKKVISADMLKQGVVLINVGLRKERGKLKGDYDEREIKNIASFYTPTPGGTGPIDVIYLYKNLIETQESRSNP